MSEIDSEGLLPPNVHHARPGKPNQPDEEADREREEDPGRVDGGTDPDSTGDEHDAGCLLYTSRCV